MKESLAVQDGLQRFYERFSAQDADDFADVIATCDGVSVIGSAPGEGHEDRDSWLAAFREFVSQAGLTMSGGANPRAWEEGTVGFAVDQPRFVMPDGSYLPTRLTAVLHQEYAEWKIVHLHFSVGVPDEDAIQPPD